LALAIDTGDCLMGALAGSPPTDQAKACNLTSLPIDDRRGLQGMICVILTEGSLFVCLFSAYFYLGIGKNRWAADQPPKLLYALIMLVVLLSSSAVIEWGEHQISRQRYVAARIALIVTIGIGLVFMVLQGFEYTDHWKTLTPYSDSYGSIFYALTTFHAAHVMVGLMLLSYVAFLPRYGSLAAPFRPYKVVSLYWHFVDVVWIFIVLILYLIPHFTAHG
jgi:heme/copper-type cytochrome/quinol oxidase subunit 3